MSASNTSAILPGFASDWIETSLRFPQELSTTKEMVIGLVLGLLSVVQYLRAKNKEISVPAVGPAGLLTSYYGAFKAINGLAGMLEEGYRKFEGKTFKVPSIREWFVVVNTRELVEEMRKAPDDTFSATAAIEDVLCARYTMGPLIVGNHYHERGVRVHLTKSIGPLYDEILEEVSLSFDENIAASGSEWVTRHATEVIMQVSARTSNCVLVGLPLCRDPEFLKLGMNYTAYVGKVVGIMNFVPDLLQGVVGGLITVFTSKGKQVLKFLKPVIEERLRQIEKYGKDYPGKRHDMLSWCIDSQADSPIQRTPEALSIRMLILDFASIHTSTMVFTHALYHLAANPERYLVPLRDEVDCIIEEEGWSKDATQKMRKVDSFVKESQRVNGIGKLSMLRKVLKDHTLSDGTFLPSGTTICCNANSIQNDERNYINATEFDGFRFAKMTDAGIGSLRESGESNAMVSTSPEFLIFGHGKHACPGRFFAAAQMKTMLAYLVKNYDIKLEDSAQGKRPGDLHLFLLTMPNPTARVMFRRRQ